MKTKNRKMLPKTIEEIRNGGVYSQNVRCGKQSCKCARGEPHVAFYFFTRRGGKLTKTYIRKAELKHFTGLVNQAAENKIAVRLAVKSSQELLKELRLLLRERNFLINHLKGA